MRSILIIVLAAVLPLAACAAPARGETGIEVHEVWARPALQGGNGAVYFVIHNHSAQTDELTGASSDIAGTVEIHESQMSGDVMQMHKLESLALEPDAEIAFAPGGFHIMLIGLQRDLVAGDEFQLTLHFANHEDITLGVPVRETPAPEENHSSSNH